MLASVKDMCNQAKNVLSFAKKTLGSTFIGTLRGFCKLLSIRLYPEGLKNALNHDPVEDGADATGARNWAF